MAQERLQKILSAAGIASRRKAEQLIVEGRVTVNGAVVIELGTKADLETDHIKVDGKLLHRPKHLIYIALHKPNNCMTTVDDFANGITSAIHHIPKTYLVKVTGTLSDDQEEAFRNGVRIEGRVTAAAGLKLVHRAENPWYEVRLFEGRKNQIRMMFKHFGLLVEKLKRVKIGFLELGPLKPAEFRYLVPEEVERFRRIFSKTDPKKKSTFKKKTA